MTRERKEYLKNVSFSDNFESRYLKAVKLIFNQEGKIRMFDLALTHCSVATLLYHIEFKKFLVVRQFRPAVFVGRITRLPENKDKSLTDINWSKFDIAMGYTLELCAGLIDKDIPIKDIAREEIEEECGYRVKTDNISLITTYLVSADESGNTQYLFYAEIDESMKISEGGGNLSEREDITKVFLTEDEVTEYIRHHSPPGPPGLFYAFMWWFHRKHEKTKNSLIYKFSPQNFKHISNIHFEFNCKSNRFCPKRMFYTLGSMTRSWDMALRADSISILLYNRVRNSIVLNQRFRPAALIGRARHVYSKNQNVSEIDWTSQPPEWAYTLELCSGRHRIRDVEENARNIVATKAGYNLLSLDFVVSFILGISQSGDCQRIYYGEVDDSSVISGYCNCEDIVPVFLPVSCLRSFLSQCTATSPPSVLYMIRWFLEKKQLFYTK